MTLLKLHNLFDDLDLGAFTITGDGCCAVDRHPANELESTECSDAEAVHGMLAESEPFRLASAFPVEASIFAQRDGSARILIRVDRGALYCGSRLRRLLRDPGSQVGLVARIEISGTSCLLRVHTRMGAARLCRDQQPGNMRLSAKMCQDELQLTVVLAPGTLPLRRAAWAGGVAWFPAEAEADASSGEVFCCFPRLLRQAQASVAPVALSPRLAFELARPEYSLVSVSVLSMAALALWRVAQWL